MEFDNCRQLDKIGAICRDAGNLWILIDFLGHAMSQLFSYLQPFYYTIDVDEWLRWW